MNSSIQQDYGEMQSAYTPPKDKRINVYEISGLFPSSEGIKPGRIAIIANDLEEAILTARMHFKLREVSPRKVTITSLDFYLRELKINKNLK